MSVILRPGSWACSPIDPVRRPPGRGLAATSLISAMIMALVLALAIPVDASGPEGAAPDEIAETRTI